MFRKLNSCFNNIFQHKIFSVNQNCQAFYMILTLVRWFSLTAFISGWLLSLRVNKDFSVKHLARITPSAEQLKIISTNQLGAELIRGSAGSGKTTTALLRLSSLANMMRAKKDRVDDPSPVKVLLLTFNRTLAGYVTALAESQVGETGHAIEISTFAKWAVNKLGIYNTNANEAYDYLIALSACFQGLETKYVVQEVDYLLGRFEPEDLELYITTERTGRGALPRVGAELRRRILDTIVYPYLQYLEQNNWLDWNRLAIKMRTDLPSLSYDLVVVDESQDFSANQIRTIKHHLAREHAVTFVIDTAQRIYARGFTWVEAGVTISANRSHLLGENHRNTREIAAFAAGIMNGLVVDSDGALPDLNAAGTRGMLPEVISGRYQAQMNWAVNYIKNQVDLANETVAFLKPEGGAWFRAIESKLEEEGIEFVKIQRNAEWPEGNENVALSTFHSAKGLEFDHVIIIGFNQENTQFGVEEFSDQIVVLRRLLAVAVARARKHVVVGYKTGEESRLVDYFEPGTYREVVL
ncbi:UvrD-helicase domain-containing protein [Alteromonas sp. BL110]|uniref:UvrD-helicase domain-containing protein n=1 Tax=Alteromonas sp. BL110 TaxID=1714845 RepID=UPI00196717FA|nr:UvrD-helicase domain-containing protein [Alteromonas sp. BL110]